MLGGRGARAESSGNNERPYDPANDFARFDIQPLSQAHIRIPTNPTDTELVTRPYREFRVDGHNLCQRRMGLMEARRATRV